MSVGFPIVDAPYPGIIPGYPPSYYPHSPSPWAGPIFSAFPPASPDRKPILFMAMGTQRCGKSTEGRKWQRRQVNVIDPVWDGYPRYLWDSDLLRVQLYKERYCRAGEPMVFAVKNYAIRTALASGSDVFCAGTHLTKASVRRLLEIDPELRPVVFDTPLEVCLERARATGQEDLLEVIPRSHANLRAILERGVHAWLDDVRDDIDRGVRY